MDVLPARAGKGAAMEWVRRKLGFAAEHTVACGDGPNDLLMLQQVRGRGVQSHSACTYKDHELKGS